MRQDRNFLNRINALQRLLGATFTDSGSYYAEPFRQKSLVVLADLPSPYINARVTASITASSGNAACAMCIPGRSYPIGGTQYGIEAGIRDFCTKTETASGLITVTEGRFLKTLRANVRADAVMFTEIQEQLELLRATPCLWIADDTGNIPSVTVFGFYKDFKLLWDMPTAGMYQLWVEGMT